MTSIFLTANTARTLHSDSVSIFSCMKEVGFDVANNPAIFAMQIGHFTHQPVTIKQASTPGVQAINVKEISLYSYILVNRKVSLNTGIIMENGMMEENDFAEMYMTRLYLIQDSNSEIQYVKNKPSTGSFLDYSVTVICSLDSTLTKLDLFVEGMHDEFIVGWFKHSIKAAADSAEASSFLHHINFDPSISHFEPLDGPPIPFLCAPSDPKWKNFIGAAINALDIVINPKEADRLTVSLALSVLCYVDETFYTALKPHCEFIDADILVTRYYKTNGQAVNKKPIEKVWEWHSIIAILGAFGKGGLPSACKAFEKSFIAFNRTVSQPSNNLLQVNDSFYKVLKAQLDVRMELRITLMKHYFSWNIKSLEAFAVDAQVKLFLSYAGLGVYKHCLNWAMSTTSGCLAIPIVTYQCDKAMKLYNSNKKDTLFPYSYCLGKDTSEYVGDKYKDICRVLTILYPDSVGKATSVVAQSKKSSLSVNDVERANKIKLIPCDATEDVSKSLGMRGSHNSCMTTTTRRHTSVQMHTRAKQSGTSGPLAEPSAYGSMRDRSPMSERDREWRKKEAKVDEYSAIFDFLK